MYLYCCVVFGKLTVENYLMFQQRFSLNLVLYSFIHDRLLYSVKHHCFECERKLMIPSYQVIRDKFTLKTVTIGPNFNFHRTK